MKHVGWCLEKIQIAFRNMPKELTSEDSKKQAINVIDDVQKYADTLVDLVHHHKFEELIHNLEHIPIEGIKLQTNHIKELFKDLEHALYIIDLTLKELRDGGKTTAKKIKNTTIYQVEDPEIRAALERFREHGIEAEPSGAAGMAIVPRAQEIAERPYDLVAVINTGNGIKQCAYDSLVR